MQLIIRDIKESAVELKTKIVEALKNKELLAF